MANSFVDTSVNNFITYYYVVTAVNGGGESSNSNQASVTYIPQPPQLPSAPAGLTATAGNAQVGLNWTATQGALYYDVQREALGGTWALIAPYVPQPSYNDTSVTNGTTYNYQVAAVNAAGTGPWSAVASATTPVPPLPAGLFSVTQVGYYYSDGLGHSCDFASVNHLYSCGISPQDYNSPTVPNYNILPSNTISSGTCTCGLYSLPYTWQGPQTSFVVSPNQNAYVSISNVNYPPYWLTLVFPGGPGTTKYPNGYTNFESSLQNAKQAGMNIVEIALNSDELTSWPFNGNFQGCYTNNGINSCNQDDAYLEQVVSSLAEPVVPNVPYYIIFRISYQSSAARLGMYKPFNSGTDSIVRLDAMGDSYSDPSVDTNSQYSWFYHQQVVQNVLRYLDTNLPGRVIGFKTDEKFLTPSTQKSDGTWGPATNYLTGYFGDYSTSQSSAYCAWWSQLPSPPNVNCSMPNTSMRNATNDGTNFISGIDANSLNAIYFNQFSAVHLADTFKGLGQAVQDVSQGKAINSFFYGYANALDDDLPESQHTALGYAEGLPQINRFVSPYSYYNARNLGNAFFGGGVGDSAALYGKLYSNEDDLYTYLCAQKDPTCQNYYQTIGLTTMASGSLSNTISYLRRDFVTAAVRGQGLYLLDLDPNTAGSFSNSTDPSDTGTLWQAITQDLGTASKVDFTTQYNYVPEVAVFVDETAAAYEPLNQSANVSNGNLYRTHSFITGALEQLSQAGIVWREYLMSDLLNEKDPVPLDNVKFAIFLNPVNITSAIQTAIQNKLENSDRALLYVYAPGLFGQGTNSDVANPAQISAITGMNIVQGAGSLTNPQTQVSFDMPSTGAHPQPFGITDGGTWSPWFYVNDPYAVTLGTYILNNVPSNFSSLAWKQKQGYSVYYSALPFYSGEAISAPSLPSSPLAIPAPLLRYMASNAGVHFFTDIITDSVDAGGNTMVLNAMYTATRTVYLPWTVNEVDEDTDTGSTTDAVTTTICKNCSSFTVSLTGPDTHVYRWK